ncbi:hypothetical protein RHGRI_020611 [Rhododendron griersonianum]|uniref:Uncharacterized protein n=1 Tax=Rhododendron griersonianum TaxID=479676 RepID=A0AAV6JMM8_9ERIC|nr:hypothetical protein RHGRI_020611 [Rhododendron griersonianum]
MPLVGLRPLLTAADTDRVVIKPSFTIPLRARVRPNQIRRGRGGRGGELDPFGREKYEETDRMGRGNRNREADQVLENPANQKGIRGAGSLRKKHAWRRRHWKSRKTAVDTSQTGHRHTD